MKSSSSMETNQFLRRPQGSGGEFQMQNKYGPYRPLIAAWLLQTVLTFGLYKISQHRHIPDIFDDDSSFTTCTNFKIPAENKKLEFTHTEIIYKANKLSNLKIKKLLQEKIIEWNQRVLPENSPLIKNIDSLGKTFNLNEAETSLLFLSIINEQYRIFSAHLDDWSPYFNKRELAKFVGQLMGYSTKDILMAIHPDGKLARIGLLTVENRSGQLDGKFELMAGLSSILDLPYRTENQLLSCFMTHDR